MTRYITLNSERCITKRETFIKFDCHSWWPKYTFTFSNSHIQMGAISNINYLGNKEKKVCFFHIYVSIWEHNSVSIGTVGDKSIRANMLIKTSFKKQNKTKHQGPHDNNKCMLSKLLILLLWNSYYEVHLLGHKHKANSEINFCGLNT